MKNTRLTTTLSLTHAHRVYIYNVTVYAGTTRTCVSTCARDAGTHGDVFNVHTTPTPEQHDHNTTRRQRKKTEKD